ATVQVRYIVNDVDAAIAFDELNRSFTLVRALPCDAQPGGHGAQYNVQAKYAKLRSGGSNPPSSIRAATSSRRRSQRRCSARSSPSRAAGSLESHALPPHHRMMGDWRE